MATIIIPEKRITKCDCCGVTVDPSGLGRTARRRKSVLKYEGDGLDYLGDPYTNAGWSLDLCDHCYTIIIGAIEGTAKSIKDTMALDDKGGES
jgi:hypothetical protein